MDCISTGRLSACLDELNAYFLTGNSDSQIIQFAFDLNVESG